MRISDVMTPDVSVISPDKTVRDAARKMDELNVGSLPVCNGTRLIGMITDRDIVVRCVAAGTSPGAARIADIMSRHVRWCFVDDSLEEVESEMAAAQIRRMPVVDRQKNLVGIVALGDLATNDAPGTRDTLRRISEPSEPDRTESARRRGDDLAAGSNYFEGVWSQYGNDDVARARRGDFVGRSLYHGEGLGASGVDVSEDYARAPDDGMSGSEDYDRIYGRSRELPVFDRARASGSLEIAEDYRGRGPRSYRRSDARIKEELGERLLDDSNVDASGIEIAVEERAVTLTGEVPDRATRRGAEDIALSIAGVEQVKNDLRVGKSKTA